MNHDEKKIAAVCRAAARWAMLAGRIPIREEMYRPMVLRVLNGEAGASPLDKAIVEAIALWDAARTEAEEPVAWSITLRGDAKQVLVDVVHSRGDEARVQKIVDAALGAAVRAA